MFFSTAFLLALVVGASARLVNITIDDQYGDARTGRLVSYDSSARWAECSEGDSDLVVGTLDGIDWTQVQNGTLHYARAASEYDIGISFEGTAIYAFFVLDSRTSLDMSWFLENDTYATVFHYDATTEGPKYRYHTLGLRRENLKPGPHRATIMFHPPKVNGTSVGNITMPMFDYASTEVDDIRLPDSSTAEPQRHGIAILCSLLGCALLVILAALLWQRHALPALSPFQPVFSGAKRLENASKGRKCVENASDAFSTLFVPRKSL